MFYAILALVERGRRGHLPRPGLPDLRVDDPLRRRHAGAAPRCARRTTSGSTPTSCASLVTPRTKLIIFNSPHNPTGGVLTREDLRGDRRRRARARHHRSWPTRSTAASSTRASTSRSRSLPGMAERTIVLDGFSKTYAMTGWRLGYAIVPPSRSSTPYSKLIINCVSCTSGVQQIAAVEALDRAAGRGRRDGRRVPRPPRPRRRGPERDPRHRAAACRRARSTSSPNISGTGMTGAELADRLLYEAGVCVLPGTAFGKVGADHIRISYANSRENLREALERIGQFRERAPGPAASPLPPAERRTPMADRPRVFVARRIPDEGLDPHPRRDRRRRLAGRAAAAARRAAAPIAGVRRRPGAADRQGRRRVPRRGRAAAQGRQQLRRRLRQHRRPRRARAAASRSATRRAC